MNFKDIFNFSLMKTKRNKNKKYYMLLIILCILITLGILTFSSNFQRLLDISFLKNIGFRTLQVLPKNDNDLQTNINELSKIEHVVDVHSSEYDNISMKSDLTNDGLDGSIALLYGTENTLPEIINGRKFNSNETGVAICPMNFYPDSSIFKIDDKKIIHADDFLNKSFTVTYNSYKVNEENYRLEVDKEIKKTFKVVGFYNNSQIMKFNNECFISASDMKEITKDYNTSYVTSGVTVTAYLTVVVDDVNNINLVLSDIKNLNFEDAYIVTGVNAKMVTLVNILCLIILALVLFTISMFTYSYAKKNILTEQKNIGILKTFGYTKKDVILVYISEFLIINITCFIVGSLLFVLFFMIVKNNFLSVLLHIGFNITFNALIYILSFVITVIFPSLIVVHYINKKNKLNVNELLKEE